MANEKRLIDANEVKKKIWYGNSDPSNLRQYASGFIDNATTVDAVEVVRCRDCKYWHEETGWCDHHSWFVEEDGEPCHPWESNNWKMLNADDFCSYGERSSDNA